MTRGVVLFAFNSPKYNYYKMAEYSARRINHFLKLPVTVITDEFSIPENQKYKFDHVVKVSSNPTNLKDGDVWINKDRFNAFKLSPYDETLVLDVDYIVNSDRLLKIFEYYDDFCCHDSAEFIMHNYDNKFPISSYGINMLWATVMAFKKTDKAKHIFDCMEMVQNNFSHYAVLHNFYDRIFRNDYAITLALRMVNGHIIPEKEIIPWNLVHIGESTHVYKENESELDSNFTVLFDNWNKNKVKKEFIKIKDFDFHLMNKKNFLEFM